MDDANLLGMADASQPPQDDLGRIVELVTPKLGQLGAAPTPLEGGITNRNYRARFGETDYVIRVPGKDTNLLEINRRCEVAANDRAAQLGVAPPVAVSLEDPAAIVTEFVTGHGMSSEELREPSMMSRVAVSLARIHDAADAPQPCTIFNSFRLVETYAKTAADRGASIPDAYEGAHATAARIEEALSGPEHDPVPCHNDLLAANFIRGDADQVWIVDWEYAGMGDRYFDLANFAVNNELDPSDERALLRAYFDETPTTSQLAALSLMKFMSDFREAMWGVVQSAVSEIEFDFTGYGSKHFERMNAIAAGESFERSLGEASGSET